MDIQIGDSCWDVLENLGEPDKERMKQLLNWFDWYYAEHKSVLVFENLYLVRIQEVEAPQNEIPEEYFTAWGSKSRDYFNSLKPK